MVGVVPGDLFTIEQLADAVGLPVRTIRYYTTEALLPRPVKHGRRAVYTGGHLRRLQLVTKLKEEAYLPLQEIRMRLNQLSDQEVEAALRDWEQRGSQQSRGEGASGSYRPSLLSALGVEASASPAPTPSMALGQSTGQRPMPWQLPGGSGLPYGYAEVFPEPAPGEGERWRRLTLAPGVELHVSDALSDEAQARIAELLRAADEILGGRRREGERRKGSAEETGRDRV